MEKQTPKKWVYFCLSLAAYVFSLVRANWDLVLAKILASKNSGSLLLKGIIIIISAYINSIYIYIYIYSYICNVYMEVSWKRGTPASSIWDGVFPSSKPSSYWVSLWLWKSPCLYGLISDNANSEKCLQHIEPTYVPHLPINQHVYRAIGNYINWCMEFPCVEQ